MKTQKTTSPFRNLSVVAASLALTASHAHSQELLAVDFGGSDKPVESGVVGQSSTAFTHTTPAGDITVTITGVQGLFDYVDNTGTAHPDLFRDFYFKNGGDMILTLSGPGISANLDYTLNFWSLYGLQARNTTITGTTGTTGPNLGPIPYEINPSSLNQNSVSGTYTADSSGNLTLTLSGTNSRPALNAFTITPASTPGSYAAWIAGFPNVGSETAIEDDPDGDGIDNGVENILGSDPSVFSQGITTGQSTPGTFTFSHPQNSNQATDIAAVYLWSKNLETFQESGSASVDGTTATFDATPNSPDAGTTTVTATISGTPTNRIFIKVRAIQAVE